jgi:hypothetical protein
MEMRRSLLEKGILFTKTFSEMNLLKKQEILSETYKKIKKNED